MGYDLNLAKRSDVVKAEHYSALACPMCASLTLAFHSEMNGDKWIIYAEGAWPESGFENDFSKISNIPRSERWLDLIYSNIGLWPDISESDTLRAMHKEDEDADKHLCPLPKSIARRAIELYTVPGEIVFTPFLGSGTEVDQALRLGRRAIGIELKPEYFMMAAKNATDALREKQQPTLFDYLKAQTNGNGHAAEKVLSVEK